MSSSEFVQSSEWKTILEVDGNEYYQKRENKLTTPWNCSHYQTLSCRTTAITSGEQLIRFDEPQSRYLFGKSWSEKSLWKDQGVKWSFNPRSFGCISISGSEVPIRNSKRTLEKLRKDVSQPKISVFAVNSRYRIFQENEVPRTGGEGEKRIWTSSGWKDMPSSERRAYLSMSNFINKLL